MPKGHQQSNLSNKFSHTMESYAFLFTQLTVQGTSLKYDSSRHHGGGGGGFSEKSNPSCLCNRLCHFSLNIKMILSMVILTPI